MTTVDTTATDTPAMVAHVVTMAALADARATYARSVHDTVSWVRYVSTVDTARDAERRARAERRHRNAR